MRTFQLTVLVDQAKANPVTIVTEPPLEGRPLAVFGQWIGDARRDLKDGEYTLTLGAAEDGVQGTGPDQTSLNLLRRKLVEPMTEGQGLLESAYRFQALDDDALVEVVADTLADGIGTVLTFSSPERFAAGFLKIKVVDSAEAVDRAMAQIEVDMLSEIKTDDEARRQRIGDLLAQAATAGITPRATDARGPLDTMVSGTHRSNPFAVGANAKLQDRLDRLAPQIEAATMRFVLDGYARAHERTGSTVAALRANFNLG